ncbi:MAG: DOMON domain-containing protein [Candidatus Heimdallarchaeota archaeon]|nr:DOMON domain-containing protein [Candidatus Heimdallarchaeota archaeon]
MKLRVLITLIVLLAFVPPTSLYGSVVPYDDLGVADASIYRMNFDNLIVDGIIETDEYPEIITLKTVTDTVVTSLAWGHNLTHIAVALQASTTGWIAIGMGDVGVVMENADIIMGAVASNTAIIQDMYSTGYSAPGVDTRQDIVESDGIEDGGITTIEFLIPMSSDDTEGYDHNWGLNNTFGFFAGVHFTSDSFTEAHDIHTASLTVEIHSIEIPPKAISRLDINLFEITGQNTVRINVSIIDTLANTSLPDLEINFYIKTTYGKIFFDSQISNQDGNVSTTYDVSTPGNYTFFAIFLGSSEIRGGEASVSHFVEGEIVSQLPYYQDLRDYFDDEHLMRSFILFMFYLTIICIILAYISVFRDLFRIKSIGKRIKE